MLSKIMNYGVVKVGDVVVDKPWWLKKTVWATIFAAALPILQRVKPEWFGHLQGEELADKLISTLGPTVALVAYVLGQHAVDGRTRPAALNLEAARALGEPVSTPTAPVSER